MTAKDRQQYIQFINFLQLEGLLDEDRNMIIPYEIVDRYAEQQVKNNDSLDNVVVRSFSEDDVKISATAVALRLVEFFIKREVEAHELKYIETISEEFIDSYE